MKYLFKSKTPILILILLATLIFIIVLQILRDSGSESEVITAPTPSPKPIIQQDPVKQNADFYVTGTTLDNNRLNIADAFVIFFSKPLADNGLVFEIAPSIELDAILDRSGSVLTISPKQTWHFDTDYTFTIKGGTRSFDGYRIESDVNLNFRTVPYSGI